jgi:hypothetical protein
MYDLMTLRHWVLTRCSPLKVNRRFGGTCNVGLPSMKTTIVELRIAKIGYKECRFLGYYTVWLL